MNNESPPSFSAGRKWGLTFNVLLSVAAMLALVAMINYLAARHFARLPVSELTQVELSPLSKRVIASVTNDLKVIIYFDAKEEPLYDAAHALLKEYKFSNPRIEVETVDYVRDPAAANLVKAKYKLNQGTDKNLIIFDCNGSTRYVYDSELSDVDIQPLISGQGKELRRTHFKGEMLFTSAILNVITPRALKAYFIQGHGEHRPDSDDKLLGYSKFARVLKENNILWEPLSLLGTNDVPPNCSLLIVAGPKDSFLKDELDKIDRYLKQGGRMLALFRPIVDTVGIQLGLEKLLATWGVAVGDNVVIDPRFATSVTGNEFVVRHVGTHALLRPLYESRGLDVVLPRSVGKMSGGPSAADAPQVEVLATTSPEGRILTDIQKGAVTPRPDDVIGSVPLMVAVEKGNIRGVSAERGSTRMVIVGESIFLGNETIDKLANREFASHALNWLLARQELLVSIPPRPIRDIKLTLSDTQLSTLRWILMLGMPGSVVLMGLLVSVRRRK